MASQREQVLPVAPQFRDAPTDAQPTVQTGIRREVAPRRSLDTGMEGITSALSNFFGKGEALIDRAADIEHRDEMIRTRRENEGLKVEGEKDALAGNNADPSKMQRYDYFTAYQGTLGHSTATKLSTEFANVLASAPTDGSFDAAKAQNELLTKEFGKGTGEKVFDDQFLVSFKKSTDPLVRAHAQAVVQTTQQNAIDSLKENITGLLTSQQGFLDSDVKDLQDRAIAFSGGDAGKGKKLFTAALTAGIVNPGQAHSTLIALEKSGWAAQNPVEYLELSSRAARRVAETSSFEALREYSALDNKLDAMLVDPSTTGKDLLDFNRQVEDTFRRLGGQSAASSLSGKIARVFPQFMKDKAIGNAILAAHDGGKSLQAITSILGSNPGAEVEKHFDAAMVELARRPGADGVNATYPALLASANGGQFMNPLASDETAREFVSMVSNSKVLAATSGMLSTNYKSFLSRGLTNPMNPETQARALLLFKAIEPVVGQDFIGRYMDKDAEGLYRAARLYGSANPLNFFTSMAKNPAQAQLLKDGTPHWAQLAGSSKKDSEVESTIDEALRKGLRDSADRGGIFGSYNVTLPNPDTRNEMMLQVALQLQRQQGTNGSSDVDTAVKLALETYKDRVVTLPGQNKTLQVYMDPLNGRGRNMESPVSVVDGQPVYSPFKIKNALGVVEDPVDTFRKDVEAAIPTLGGKFSEPKKISLQLSDRSADGLFRLQNTETGNYVFFSPGEEIHVANPDAQPTQDVNALGDYVGGVQVDPWTLNVKVPENVEEARAFLSSRLPKGFHLIDGGVMGGKQAFAVAYGFRLETGRKEADEILAKREAEVAKRRELGATGGRGRDWSSLPQTF